MSFYGMLIAFLLVSSVVLLAGFVRLAGYLDLINTNYQEFGSLISIRMEASLASDGVVIPYLNFTSSINGIYVQCVNGTYIVTSWLGGPYALVGGPNSHMGACPEGP